MDSIQTTDCPVIKVDSGIPVPPRARPGPGPIKYPWREMKVGDSFVFPAQPTFRLTVQRAAANCAGRKHNHGETYTTRAVTENGERVVRVWRIS